MNLDLSAAALLARIDQLRQENKQLKSMLRLLKENMELKAMMQSCNDESLSQSTGTSPSGSWQKSFNEEQFRNELQQTKSMSEYRTSSPIDFKSFLYSSALKNTDEATEAQTKASRLLGEIVYQLDKRILHYIFKAHKRLYGFTLLNIPDKILQVSTNPLTGKVDEGYQLHLKQRHSELMGKLSELGYKSALHPPFCEFIVNSYGILTVRPSESSSQETEYNDPEFLRKIIVTAAPRKLQRDLLLLLNCLCFMAANDSRLLFLW